jgi:hypothetical protein
VLPFASLNAATATGAGTSRDLEGLYRYVTMAMSATGSPSTVNIDLEGSHDGTNWVVLTGAALSQGAVSVNAHLIRYVRANLKTLTGGSSPTVTATIATVSVRGD